jgi:hypothetical protein
MQQKTDCAIDFFISIAISIAKMKKAASITISAL